MQANVPARTIYYQLYGGQDVDHVTTGNIDEDRCFSQSEILDGRGVSLDQGNTVTASTESRYSSVTSSQENSSAIEANSKSAEEANSKSIEDTGSEVKMYDFSKLLEN